MESHIFITGPIGQFEEDGQEVNGISLVDVVMQSRKPASRYIVHFDSPGGNVDEANLIQNHLANLQEIAEVVAVGEGLVASAASKIFLSINKRAATDKFEFMMHNPWGGVQGDAAYIESYAEGMRKLEKEYESYYAERLNIDQQTVSNLMDKETFLTLDQCKNLNIINYELVQTPAIVAVAKIKSMKLEEKDKNWLEQMVAEIKTALAPKTQKPVALTIMSKEGAELVFPGDAPAVGDSVDAPDGSYTIDYSDKVWTVVITGGVVESLDEVAEEEPAPNEEMEALKAENADLKKQIQDVTAKVETMTAYVAKLKAIESKGDPKDGSKDKFDQKQEDPIKAYKDERKAAAQERKQKFNKR